MDTDTLTLDPAIVAALPVRGEVVAIFRHGDTNWSYGYKIIIEIDDDDHEFFVKVLSCRSIFHWLASLIRFMKILDREDAKELAEGEYESMVLMHKLIPEAIVPPIAWGMFETDSSKAFYLTYFRDLDKQLPSDDSLIRLISKIHQKESPTGKFGFHVPTFYGCRKVDNSWCESWEEFFSRELRSSINFAQAVLQHDEELEGLAKTFIDLVVPRLLRPLETGGRSIKPHLVFGDLWDANVQVDSRTRAAALFDPCCFYGHFEFDFQCMTSDRYSLNYNFVYLYRDRVGVSEPAEEFDDRVALYALRNDFHTMGMWPRWTSVLDHVKSEMNRLIEKYPDGLHGLEVNTALENNTAFEENTALDYNNPLEENTVESATIEGNEDIPFFNPIVPGQGGTLVAIKADSA
ncbi:unnamed protein product [Clonostachys solani]|uniref:protein-ribulosamine 3-kinase n=1 Tax=Clonostachys solani TaxID=160281 RepID=A0A9N9ZBB2_9HYPO|nr:unnamed protein product [Clonostachys solani]